MSDLNEVKLTGNLGDNPKILKENESGCFVKISLGTNKKRKDKATGKVIKTTLWTTVCFNNMLAGIVLSNCKKGDKVFIAGELRSTSWTGKSGKTRSTMEIHATRCLLIAKSSVNKRADTDESEIAMEEAA